MRPEGLALRFLLGAIAGVLVTSAYLHGIDQFWISGLLMSATTIGLGIWIHESLHRRSVVGRIPMDHIANSSRKISELLRKCADEQRAPHRRIALRQLSNEISWFLEIPRVVRPVPAHLEEDLLASYFEFKGVLDVGNAPEARGCGSPGSAAPSASARIRGVLHHLRARTGSPTQNKVAEVLASRGGIKHIKQHARQKGLKAMKDACIDTSSVRWTEESRFL
jgi:hypothetical protein